MRRFILFLVTALTLLASSAHTPSKAEREAWMKEIQQYKNEYMAKKLDLSDDQKVRFAPVLDRMDAELRKVQSQARKLCRDVTKKGDKATELETEKAAEAQFEVKAKEAEIEMKYYKEFKSILTPRQMLKFKDAERDFTRDLMKKHREHRGGQKPDKDRKSSRR